MPSRPDTNRWSDPPADPSVSPTDVDIWRVGLERNAASLSALRATLSEEERGRAERFVFPTDRDHFLAARGALRGILARYLRTDPARIAFRTTEYGKPFLETESAPASESLRFNLSHSGDRALCAVTRAREIGIDVERVRQDFDVYEIADRFFSRAEVASLRALPEASLREGFFTCWTRKEAYIKARGEGLSMPLDSFDVSLEPGSPARLLSVRGEGGGANWALREILPGPGYVAAVAVGGPDDFRVRAYEWGPV